MDCCIRRSLDSDSAATLVHAFVSSREDYCNAIFVGAPKNVTDKLQWVLNAAACIVSGTWKYDHGLTDLMHNELHWLDVPDRVKYKLGMLMYRCQHNQAPRYLMDHCSPVSDVVFRQRLCSCDVIGSAPTAIGRFLLLDQLSGTHCLMTYVFQNVLPKIIKNW